MKKIFAFAFLFALSIPMMQAQSLDTFFKEADAFLKKNVDANGLVDYAGIKANPVALHTLYKQIGAANISSAPKNTQKAFLINAYNLVMIKSVIDNYPIKSPLDVNGLFDTRKHKVAGAMLTLSDIENKKLRVEFPDARLHFVLVCGALSCPKLANFAVTPSNLESTLTSRTKKALNDPNFIRVDESAGKVEISKIFEWYAGDFQKGNRTFVQYINAYRTNKIPESYKVGFYTYDWTLNLKKK